MKIFMTIITILISASLYSQLYTGVVKEINTNQPLPYVNIGILNKGIGTVSQYDGSFIIEINETYINDTIRISIIGYKKKIVTVKSLIMDLGSGNNVIFLEPDLQELSIVEVRPRDMRDIVLGNTFKSPTISAGFKTNDLGSEIGTIMKVKDGRTYYLKTAGFNIAKCNYDSILFRINIYNLIDHKPGEILHSLPIYAKAVKGQKELLIDLKPYNITVDDDFILTLEWIQDLPDKTTSFLFFAGFGNRIFYKKTSQDTWSTFPIGIGNWCLAEFEK